MTEQTMLIQEVLARPQEITGCRGRCNTSL